MRNLVAHLPTMTHVDVERIMNEDVQAMCGAWAKRTEEIVLMQEQHEAKLLIDKKNSRMKRKQE